MAQLFTRPARILGIVVLAGLALAHVQPGIGHAAPAGMRTYTDRQTSYTLQYPSNWKHMPNAVKGEFAVESPDGNAAVVAVTNASAEARGWTIQQALGIFLKGAGQTQHGTPALKDFDARGTTMQTAIVGARTSDGTPMEVFLVMASHRGRMYFVVGEVAKPQSATGQREVSQVITSIASWSLN